MPHEVRVTRISDAMIALDLGPALAPCALSCRFCPRAWSTDPRGTPPADEATRDRLRARVAEALAAHPGPDVWLQGDDVLAYPDVLGLLDVAREAGKRVHLVTPGLALADRALAERFAGRDLRFDLTVHALDPAVVSTMTGRDDALEALLQALDHLRDLQIEHLLGVVVTRDNVAVLADTVRGLAARHAVERLHLRLFYPDTDRGSPAYLDQFPAFDAVMDQLRALDGDAGPLPVLHLSNAPPCQLDLQELRRLRVVLAKDFNAHRAPDLPACARCPAAVGCARLHPAYGRRHAVRTPDLQQVAAVLAAQDAPEEPRGDTPDPEDATSLPVTPDGRLRLVVEPRREGQDYWLSGPAVGVYYVHDAATEAERAQVARQLERVRARLAQGPPLTLAAATQLAAWLRRRLR
ncbi:MAG: radical SAM protein [Alphaproteobacteria bacterium]|nr:radical SAM protein [Alphaproteobacteria bacterium]